MTKNKSITKWINIYFMFSVLCTIAMNGYVLFSRLNPSTAVGGALGLICCALAIIYAAKGYSKNAALYYKLFMAALFVSFQLGACTAGVMADGLFAGMVIAGQCLVGAFTLALALGHDLGKKRSLAFCLATVAITGALAVALFIMYPGILRNGTDEGTVATFRSAANFFMAQVMLVMTTAKYKDKAARGTV